MGALFGWPSPTGSYVENLDLQGEAITSDHTALRLSFSTIDKGQTLH